MAWSVDWEVVDGARGTVFGDEENTVYQHETMRFTVRLRGTDQNARDFVADESNWTQPPQMFVTGIDGLGRDVRTNTVEHARGSLLTFEYQFEYAGRKRIEFRGEIDMRRAQGERHGGVGARSTTMAARESADTERYDTDVYTTYPPLALMIPFMVEERSTEGEAHATRAGEGPTSRARERVIEEERDTATAERESAEAEERVDRRRRNRRARAARDEHYRPGLLGMPSPWFRLMTDEEVGRFDDATMGEYARDLQAAIRVTRPISMNGREYFDGRHSYTGHWTWAFDDGDIMFYFAAAQIRDVGGLRTTDSAEAAHVRAHSGRDKRFGRDEWIVAILPGGTQKLLTTAETFARDTDWSRLTAVIEFADYIMTAFDVIALASGVGSIIAGIERAARWLITHAARLARRAVVSAGRHADDLARGAARAMAHGSDDALRASDDVARGLGAEARGTSSGAARGLDDAARTGDDAAESVTRRTDDALSREVDDAFDAMTSGVPSSSPAARFTPPEPYTATAAARSTFESARREFSRLQRRYARRLGLEARSGAQVHHAIELNVIQRYGDDVFSVEELNALRNMRGIVPERTAMGEMSTRYGLRQLHNSAIRRRWDGMYEQINRIIADEGLVAGTPAYRTRVRGLLEHGRDVIDNEFSEFFSGSGARLPSTFVDEATDAALRGGRSAYGLTTRGTDGRITGTL